MRQLTALDYLRWFRSLFRRARKDVLLERGLREWRARGLFLAPSVILRVGTEAHLEVNGPVSIGAHTVLVLLADPNADRPLPAILRIGPHTSIGEFNNIRSSGGEIVIGHHCMISQFVSILGSNHSTARGSYMRDQPWSDPSASGVRIGDDVWIGANAVVLPGVTIGSGSVIGAGAVVTSDIPEYAIAAGVPAEVKRFR
jgi:acetyltransferase-like isoleucine patch superfamily enzyme